MSSTSASISTPPSRDLNSATKKALFEEQVSFLLERQTYLYEELLDAFQVRYQYKNNGAFSDALIKSAMRILSGEADANVKKWAEEIISNTKSHLFTDWCKRRNKKPIEKEKVTRAGRQHINQVIVEVSKNFSAITGAIGSSARSQALGPTSSTNSVSSEAKDKRSHASSRLPEVESNRETDAIEGQRIPQLGRSRSMEEELEAEAADKLHGDVATDGHIAVLNQEPEWIVKGNDVLHLFQEFKKSELSQYSLSRDGIADITSRGDFISTLDDGDFNNIIDECSSLGQDDGIKPILSNLFTTAQSSFQDAIDESVKVDRSIPIVRSVAMALESYLVFYPHNSFIPKMNERQFFSEIALPSFRQAFRQVGKDMELFEIKILGSQRRKNINRVPVIEKMTHAHQADAVVSHGGLQVVLFECASPDTKDTDKSFLDHYKLARDLKDTWIYNIETLIKNGREPPKGLSVYGVQVAGNRMELYSLDFKGCFRLQELAVITLPTRLDSFQMCFSNLVQTSFNFAKHVRNELNLWDSAPALLQAKKRKAERALRLLPITNTTPIKGKKVKISQDDEDFFP